MKIIAAPILLLLALFNCLPAHTPGAYQWTRAVNPGVNGKLWINGGKTGTT